MDPSAKPFVSASTYATSSHGDTISSQQQQHQVVLHNIVRMRGLPYTATEEDILAFLDGYRLEGDGDLTYRRGEAYLRFENGAEARRFVEEKNHGHVGERYVELQVSTPKAMQEAKDRIVAASSVNPVIRMRGLPFSVTDEEVRAFFDDVFPRETILSLRFGLDCDERRTGEAFLELTSEEAAETSLGKTKGQLGGRFVDVARSSANERETVLLASSRRVRLINPPTKPHQHHQNNNNNYRNNNNSNGYGMHNGSSSTLSNNNNNGSSSNTTSPTGAARDDGRPSAPIPLTTSPLIPQPRSGNRSRGGGVTPMQPLPAAMFPPTDPAAAAAMSVSLFQWNAMMALNAALMMGGGAFPNMGGGVNGNSSSLLGGGGAQQPPQRATSRYIVRVRGLPFSATEEIVATFFEDVDIPPQGVHMVYNAQDKPTGEAFVEVATETDIHTALEHNGAALGHRYIEVFRSSAADMQRLGGGALPGEMNNAAMSMPMMPGMMYPPMLMPPFF